MHAQPWVHLMLDGETNIHEVKAAFDETWQGRGYVRGQGWKQFHRWYWFMEQRTWPSGDRLDPAIHLEAMQEVSSMRATRSSSRDNATWEPLGPTTWNSISYNPGNGRVNVVALDPQTPSTIYAGTPGSGLWRSLDDGQHWDPLFTDLPSMGVSGIAIHPDSPDTIFIATGDGDGADTYSAGVLKSTDGGLSWETTGLNWNITQSRTTRALRMDPNDPSIMYCAASNGLFRTMDGGDSWTQLTTGSFRDVEFMPGDTTMVYACSNQFYRSTDGDTFLSNTTTGLPPGSMIGRMAIAVSPAAPNSVYALCSNEEDNSFLGLYLSNDGGETFHLRSSTPNIFDYSEDGSEEGGQAWYDMALAVDPVDPNVVYVGGINVWKSTDGGLNWEIISHWVFPSFHGYTHADIHSLDILDGRLFCGSDGGIFVSEDAGGSWIDLSAGLDITQFYRLGGSELLPELVMAGAQDNGSNRFMDDEWTHVFGGDGMEAAVDRFVIGKVYSSYQFGGLQRSYDLGENWEYIANGIDEEGAWVTPYALDPEYPNTLIAGFNNVWLSYNSGSSWEQLTFWNEAQKVRCLAIAPSNSEVIYAGRNDLVQRTLDAGFSWQNIRPGLPNLSPTSIAVDPDDPLHVWITFSGTNANQKVYESLNGGMDWVNRSAGLPNVPVNSIVIQPNSFNAVYIGTDQGIFFRDDHEPEWQIYGDGLPNVVVSELEINEATGKIRAATYGRGIWEADLFISPFVGVSGHHSYSGPHLSTTAEHGVFLLSDDQQHAPLHIHVYDALGRVTRSLNAASNGSLLDLRDHMAGTYIVLMHNDNGNWIRRVVR